VSIPQSPLSFVPLRGLIPLLLLGSLSACQPSGPWIAEKDQPAAHDGERHLTARVILVGDGGAASAGDAAMTLLADISRAAPDNSTIVFLGDNIYCCGMPPWDHPDRADAEAHLMAQSEAILDFPGRIVFLAGNHDWDYGEAGLVRQADFARDQLGLDRVFHPEPGRSGPEVLDLGGDVRLIAIDSEWWVNPHRTYESEKRTRGEAALDLDRTLRELEDERVLIVAHHPLIDQSKHGGHAAVWRHLIPFPVVGSWPWFKRRFIGGTQDLSSEPYTAYRHIMESLLAREESEGTVYAAGHAHNLQLHTRTARRRSWHHIVSGSLSKPDHVVRGHDATFVDKGPGLFVLDYFDDGSQQIRVHTVQHGLHPVFQKTLRLPDPEIYPDAVPDTLTALTDDPEPAARTRAANPMYAELSTFRSWLQGRNNRQLWATPVTLPVLDITGLVPLKMGGGSQTTTIRLRNEQGREYMIRTVDKDAVSSLSENLQRTFVSDIAQDQVSMLHPYGAAMVPPLADAVGVFHTAPVYRYVPDDPRLGPMRDPLVDRIGMFVIRPNGDMSGLPHLGHVEDVDSYGTVISKVNGDNDHRVDPHAWARARLLDMLIADSDRTPDNVRFAEVEPADSTGKIWVIVPRDRDVAFMRIGGLFPWFYKTFVEWLWQDFRPSYGSLKGLNAKALFMDRRFTAPMTRADWVALADSMKNELDDEAIHGAIEALPPEIAAIDGERTARILKIRRDKLPQVASSYYGLLADVVDVVGSHKHEHFVVSRYLSDSVRVEVYKTNKEGVQRRLLYDRTFYRNETREIRLYGQDGNDTFEFRGAEKSPITVRVVGGIGPKKYVRVPESAREDDVLYDPHGHTFSRSFPVAFFGSNKDDGLFVGAGFRLERPGFQSVPWKTRHRLAGNLAAKTGAWNVVYNYKRNRALRGWDLRSDIALLSPDNIRNFFGLGNETRNTEDSRKFYQARLSQFSIAAGLERDLAPGLRVRFLPTARRTDVRRDDDRFLVVQEGVSDNTFDEQWFAGTSTSLEMDTRDDKVSPRQGMLWTSTAELNVGVHNNTDTYGRFITDARLWMSPSISPQLSFALRTGVEHNTGDFPFYASSTLGGKDNLRGFRSTRFAGRTAYWVNTDVRWEAFRFARYLAFGRGGPLAFFDIGRVWTDGERSRVWHEGAGGGFWAELYDAGVLRATIGRSADDTTLTIGFGYQF